MVVYNLQVTKESKRVGLLKWYISYYIILVEAIKQLPVIVNYTKTQSINQSIDQWRRSGEHHMQVHGTPIIVSSIPNSLILPNSS